MPRHLLATVVVLPLVFLACAEEEQEQDDPPVVDASCTVDDPECVDWRFVTDADGRAVVLHGLNVDGDVHLVRLVVEMPEV